MEKIAVAILLLVLCGAGTGPISAQELVLPFEIETVSSAILIRGFANGRPALLIVDTGASRTILSRDLVADAPDPLPPSRFSGDGPGLSARGRYASARLELGGRVWESRSVVAMNLQEVSRAFGRRVDGLLGQDLLREFESVTIDFRARRIRLEKSREADGPGTR